MTPSRKKLITSSVLLLGVGVVVGAGITLYPSLRERYWIWRLESETEEQRLEAAERLGEVGFRASVPRLIRKLADTVENSGTNWWIDPSSRLHALPTAGFTSLRMSRDMLMFETCVNSVSRIAQRRSEIMALLEPYLKSKEEIVRAVAASVLFDGTDKAKEYVSIDRSIFGNIIHDSKTGGMDRA